MQAALDCRLLLQLPKVDVMYRSPQTRANHHAYSVETHRYIWTNTVHADLQDRELQAASWV